MRRALAPVVHLSLIASAAPAGVLTLPTCGWGIKDAGPATPSTPGTPREAAPSEG